MKIIIEVKDTATLDRIEELGKHLDCIASPFDDVIKSISKEF